MCRDWLRFLPFKAQGIETGDIHWIVGTIYNDA